jgi:hypothetical protein
MKKLFFNAVFLVAFSGVSMANTIAIEEEKEVLETVVTPSCDQERLETYNEAISNGYTHYQAYFQAAGVYMECMRNVGIEPG